MLVAHLTRLRGATLLFVEVDVDSGFGTIKLLAGPCQLVGIPNPEVFGLAKGRLDSTRIPDLLENNALVVVLGISSEVKLGAVSKTKG